MIYRWHEERAQQAERVAAVKEFEIIAVRPRECGQYAGAYEQVGNDRQCHYHADHDNASMPEKFRNTMAEEGEGEK
ncbi:MAG: hypothetical protein D3924_02615 [Candidatus Electrothrix sp. AR4]|nr:hypothetical protein [Candidatus Electrothrix sp. AR4]